MTAHILFVDNDELDLTVLQIMLKQFQPGICAEFYLSGALLFERLQLGVRPDLIVTDLSMPELNGLELTRRLKTDAETETIPVVMMSSSNAASDREAFVKAGGQVYLQKPSTPDGYDQIFRILLQMCQSDLSGQDEAYCERLISEGGQAGSGDKLFCAL